ncbi:MAG: ABC transporter ATP-binding protein [Atribacterota bacterium]
MSSVSVRLLGIAKRFGHMPVLEGVHLEIPGGQFVSIVGPSGSGKTTLLRIIAGFLQPDAGRVYIGEKDVTEVPPRLRNIGMVFQHYALFPNLNVYENVAFGLRARKVRESEIDRKVREMLTLVHLEEKMYSMPHELSGGQKQRVALARALAVEPKLLLLDEPLSALDAKVRLELRYELKRIQKEMGITTIYVTHDQEEALSISDLVAVLHQGLIEQLGTPEEIYSRPRTRFVAEFIGISTLLEAEVLSPKEGKLRWMDYVLQGTPLSQERVKLLILLRPENLSILPKERFSSLVSSWNNVLQGRVVGQVFLGSVMRVAVEVKGVKFLVDLPNREANRFRLGEEVVVTFLPEAIHYLFGNE